MQHNLATLEQWKEHVERLMVDMVKENVKKITEKMITSANESFMAKECTGPITFMDLGMNCEG